MTQTNPILRSPQLATSFAPVGHSDQGGRPDAMHLRYWREHVCVGHLFSGGFSVIDVRDPRATANRGIRSSGA